MVNAQEKHTKIERDALGRVVKQIVPRKSVLGDPVPKGEDYEYAYDALGGMVRAKNDAAEVTFTRDALNRVIEERCDGHVIESRYDAAGDRVGRSTSLGHETSYDFDGNGGLYRWRSAEQLAGLIDTTAGATWFDHDARGYLTAALRPDGTVQYRTPDVAG